MSHRCSWSAGVFSFGVIALQLTMGKPECYCLQSKWGGNLNIQTDCKMSLSELIERQGPVQDLADNNAWNCPACFLSNYLNYHQQFWQRQAQVSTMFDNLSFSINQSVLKAQVTNQWHIEPFSGLGTRSVWIWEADLSGAGAATKPKSLSQAMSGVIKASSSALRWMCSCAVGSEFDCSNRPRAEMTPANWTIGNIEAFNLGMMIDNNYQVIHVRRAGPRYHYCCPK